LILNEAIFVMNPKPQGSLLFRTLSTFGSCYITRISITPFALQPIYTRSWFCEWRI